MRRVVFNQKGGVGKSSLVCNLAALSSSAGLRTLVVDLDAQANATHHLLQVEPDALEEGVLALFLRALGRGPRKQAISYTYESPYPNLWVMPSHPQLAMLERELESRYKINKLRDALDSLTDAFDAIYIDTPPNLGFYSRAALIAADRLLVPCHCDRFSQQSLHSVMETLAEVQEDHNPELQLEGVIINQYQPRAKLPRQLVNQLFEDGFPVCQPLLSSSIRMRESHSAGKPLVWFDPRHKLARELGELFDQLQTQATA